jgi:5S rRNA maturation endonuclease (ribonuclease M5)
MIQSDRPGYFEYEAVLEELEELKELSSELPIVVEGKRDIEALRILGVEGRIFPVSHGGPFYDFCDDLLEYPDVILLTDLDRAGERLARKLRRYLGEKGVRIHEKFRRNLMRKLDVRHVEDLHTRWHRIQERVLGPPEY